MTVEDSSASGTGTEEPDADRRFVGLLAATTMGVYLLVIAGTTTSLAEAAAACGTWPTCNGQWLVSLDDPQLVIAWGHRVAALLVGVGVLVTAILAWRTDVAPRIRGVVTLALALYPVQIALGAGAATDALPVPGVHLVVGLSLFAGFVLALAWTLEPAGEAADDADRDPAPTPDPVAEAETGSPPSPPTPDGTVGLVKRRAAAYLRLTKPRLMWLLCLVAVAGMVLAAGRGLDPWTVVATLTGGVLAIGASGTFNHVLERDVDRRMARTADRPLATDEVGVRNAIVFGGVLTVASLAVFASINRLAATLGLAAILFYSVIYTLLLKPNTVQNTVIGGAAGALPALIGWAAVTGRIGIPGLLLAGLIFLWTPAHFYNLALAYREDYERGGFPMLPVVRGDAVTRKHVLYYLGATFVAAVGLGAAANLGAVYALTGVVFGGVFLWAVVLLHRERTESAALRSFHASNAYLGLLLAAIVVDVLAV